MAHHDRHPADETELDRDEREMPEEPRGADEEEFEDAEFEDEDLDDEDTGDEDIRAGDPMATDRRFTGEIGSEGGSPGDVEVASDRPSPLTGSEAGTTGRRADDDNQPSFPDRQKGPGY